MHGLWTSLIQVMIRPECGPSSSEDQSIKLCGDRDNQEAQPSSSSSLESICHILAWFNSSNSLNIQEYIKLVVFCILIRFIQVCTDGEFWLKKETVFVKRMLCYL